MNKKNALGRSSDLLSIKFEGNALLKRSIPIYELGSVLIAVQRIVHKAALFSEGKLEKGVHLSTARREQLALQISTHKKGSDIWNLAAYISDPAIGPILQNVIAAGLVAAGAYAYRRIRKKPVSPSHNQVLVVNIFPEMKQLVDRVGNIGGVDRITIAQLESHLRAPLVVDDGMQEAVRELEFQLVPGTKRVITGVVTRLLPQSFRLDVKDGPDHYVRVSMNEKLFERVRRLPVLMEREIRFEGIPMYRMGDTTGGPHEFRAEKIVLPRRKD